MYLTVKVSAWRDPYTETSSQHCIAPPETLEKNKYNNGWTRAATGQWLVRYMNGWSAVSVVRRRARLALAEDLASVSNTHFKCFTITCNPDSRGIDALFLPQKAPGQLQCAYTQAYIHLSKTI